ncbi:MerR family transcriptional regulator [Spongisporangium articulatum]|uniref:MerR family transcriptional regulator n=1 Tax=Spongisporangium articulatum TaxID=3362603 RepID=A0ABW8AQH8_9ACTN
MLTIGQLASYAGVTVRAVRHYHAKGLLPEPERDHSGYRRYGAAAVVELIRIRTLAEAGVPLSRVEELLDADPADFAAAVHDIDRRLRQEIDDRQQHRERIAQLAAGDSLALAPEAVAYFERLRELGFRERFVDVERDSWILISAAVPDLVPELMAVKRQQIEDEVVRAFFHELEEAVDVAPDDPRMDEIADRVAAFLETASAAAADVETHRPLDPDLIDLLDAAFLESFPCAPRLLELLEDRGWTGWTMIERRRP